MRFQIFIILFISLYGWQSTSFAFPGEETWNPENVVATKECTRCHEEAESVWKNTKHYKTYGSLHKSKRAKEIASEFGIKSSQIRKPDSACSSCHYTAGTKSGKQRIVQGVSCQSCHGAAADWVKVHNDYGSETASKETESAAHKKQRIKAVKAAGMVVPGDLLGLAENCYQCHLITNEDLINNTSHPSSSDFSFLERTQGNILHSKPASADKKNKLIIAGSVAEVIGSINALGHAKQANGRYADVMQDTAKNAIQSLSSAIDATGDAQLKKIHKKVSSADLSASNGSLKHLAKDIYAIATGALGENGSLKKVTITKKVAKPKPVAEKKVAPKKAKPAVKAVTTTSKPATAKKPSPAKAAAPVTAPVEIAASVTAAANSTTIALSQSTATRVQHFSLITTVSNLSCQQANPWKQGWLALALRPQKSQCYAIALQSITNDSIVIIAKNLAGKAVKLHPSSCNFLNSNNSDLQISSQLQIYPMINGRAATLTNSPQFSAATVFSAESSLKNELTQAAAKIEDICATTHTQSYDQSLINIQQWSQQHAQKVDWSENIILP